MSFLINEAKIFSQNGEDGVIASIFINIGIQFHTFIEIGFCKMEANSLNLLAEGWEGAVIDSNSDNLLLEEKIIPICARVTVENLEEILKPVLHFRTKLDFLSIDIDFNDYWILRKMLRLGFAPRVICVEYAALKCRAGPTRSISVKYDANGSWDYRTRYFGASMMAFVNLLSDEYKLVYAESRGVNLFFIKRIEVKKFVIENPEKLFRPPNYSHFRAEHDSDDQNREWVEV